ncbi:hypothetical protein [Dokdonella sp.]|uniref:hypothetical protein n=1 Tax=Dokdonella sp. TaxID=2291710 RepID=UPI001B05F176|nr:hypothetical protein [Dokdonella sp.]MBO9663963.1 hypothetical protein [Dokdonella sp.]
MARLVNRLEADRIRARRLSLSIGAAVLASPAFAFDGGGAPLLHSVTTRPAHSAARTFEPSFRGIDDVLSAATNGTRVFGAPSWLERQKVVADDGTMMEQFGWTITVAGDAVYVGAPFASVEGHARQGAVYVYAKVDGLWTQVQKLVASDGVGGENFGASVSVDGTTMLVGAIRATIGGNVDQGAAYVFDRSGGSWSEAQKLVADDGMESDDFGYALKVEGDTAIIGAPFVNDRQGAAYVFQSSGSGWTQTQKLLAGDAAPDDLYGVALAFEGSTALIGALSATIGENTDQGAVYVLTRSGNTWSEAQKLVADDGAASDRFGTAIGLSGGTAVISAIGATIDGNEGQGAAYVFDGAGGNWVRSGKLVAADGAASDNFGYSIALRGDTVLIGAPFAAVGENSAQGAAYVHARSGGAWSAGTKLVAGDGAATSFYGWSGALDEGVALVGSIGAAIGDNPFQGAVYVYATGSDDGIFCSGFEDGESGACAR